MCFPGEGVSITHLLSRSPLSCPFSLSVQLHRYDPCCSQGAFSFLRCFHLRLQCVLRGPPWTVSEAFLEGLEFCLWIGCRSNHTAADEAGSARLSAGSGHIADEATVTLREGVGRRLPKISSCLLLTNSPPSVLIVGLPFPWFVSHRMTFACSPLRGFPLTSPSPALRNGCAFLSPSIKKLVQCIQVEAAKKIRVSSKHSLFLEDFHRIRSHRVRPSPSLSIAGSAPPILSECSHWRKQCSQKSASSDSKGSPQCNRSYPDCILSFLVYTPAVSRQRWRKPGAWRQENRRRNLRKWPWRRAIRYDIAHAHLPALFVSYNMRIWRSELDWCSPERRLHSKLLSLSKHILMKHRLYFLLIVGT